MGELIFSYLFIFAARAVDVSLGTIRILMLTRGKKAVAAAIGFVEISVFILALSHVISCGLDDPWKIVAYAAGFATGNYLGSFIEDCMAVGYLSLQVFPPRDKVGKVISRLRKENFGVTSVVGAGRCGPRTILFVIVKRRDLKRVLKLLDEIDPKIFYNIYDAKTIHGGVFPGARKRK